MLVGGNIKRVIKETFFSVSHVSICRSWKSVLGSAGGN